MRTEDLIEALAMEARPVSRHTVERGLAVGVLQGAVLAMLAMTLLLGARPDLASAVTGAAFWGKAAYPAALGVAGLIAAVQLARPDCRRVRGWWLLLAPILILGLTAWGEFDQASAAGRVAPFPDEDWRSVPLILMLAIPVLVSAMAAMRAMAPTRRLLAGGAVGLVAGATAAAIYSLHCRQSSWVYLLTHYTLAIALVAAIVAAIAPRLLRW